ncbi:MAG TPA: hypothetical protein VFW47_13185, partial [Phenylobacterium sp.]|nr:hypothetical protein [Phenylobacterium sp.]
AGAAFGFTIAVPTLLQTDTPTNLALKAAYMANGSDHRPRGLSAVSRRAVTIWDDRNMAGFEWGRQMAVVDPRQCPGDHGPFHAGCVEAAQGRAGAFLAYTGMR